MNYYDKRLYKTEQEIKTALIILTVFIISFLFGFFIRNIEVNDKEQKIREIQVEIDSLRESLEIIKIKEEKESGDKRN